MLKILKKYLRIILKNIYYQGKKEILILEKYRDDLTNKINLIEKGNSCRLFDKYASRIDNHAFRAEYARNLYDELLEKKELPKYDFYAKEDKSIVCLVSQNLGHE